MAAGKKGWEETFLPCSHQSYVLVTLLWSHQEAISSSALHLYLSIHTSEDGKRPWTKSKELVLLSFVRSKAATKTTSYLLRLNFFLLNPNITLMSSNRTVLSLFKPSACLICPVASFRASRRSVILDSYSFSASLTTLISPRFSWWYFCSSFLTRASTAVSGPERKVLFREEGNRNKLC